MRRIAEALADQPLGDAEGERSHMECQGSKFHSPTPLVISNVAVGDDLVPLCGTCEGNLSVFRHLMTASNGTLSWEIRREFGNRIRALGMTDWKHRSARG